MHIHITLVGGQTAPVYSGIIHSKAESVVLVCSKQSRSEAERISSIVEVPCSYLELHPTDVSAIFRDVKAFYEGFKSDDELSVNLVGGTKPWSLVFYSLFKDRPSTRFELVDQNNRIWDFSARKWENLPPVDIDTVFRLYGNPLVRSRRFKDYNGEDKNVTVQIESFKRRAFMNQCGNAYMSLTTAVESDWDKMLQRDRSGRFALDSNNYVTWDRDAEEVCVHLTGRREVLEKRFHSPHAVDLVFNAGWFEFKVALAVAKWNQVRDIRLNCVFPLSEQEDANIKNEVDIVVSTDNKVFFFECKTSLRKPLDVDKFASVVKNYGGLGTKGVFVTGKPLKEQALKKCEDYGLLHFCIEDYAPPVNRDYWKRALMFYLESEVDSNNKK